MLGLRLERGVGKWDGKTRSFRELRTLYNDTRTVCDNRYELRSTNKTPLRLNIEGFYWGSCRQEAIM